MRSPAPLIEAAAAVIPRKVPLRRLEAAGDYDGCPTSAVIK